MTGFGRGEATVNGWKVDVELSGVNRKQADISVNLPAALIELEAEARNLLSKAISRGRLGAKISLSHSDSSENRLIFDQALARQYVAAAKLISAETGIDTRITAADLFRAPGIFKIDETGANPDEVRDALLTALENALKQLVKMQQDEGEHLRADLKARVDNIVREVTEITELAPLVPKTHRQNLMKRLSESGLELDLNDDRLLREIALFAEVYDNNTRQPHKVDIEASLRAEGGQAVFETREERDSSELAGGPGGYGFMVRVPLEDVPPGLYVLRVTGTTRIGDREEVTRETVVRVVAPPAP